MLVFSNEKHWFGCFMYLIVSLRVIVLNHWHWLFVQWLVECLVLAKDGCESQSPHSLDTVWFELVTTQERIAAIVVGAFKSA